MDTKFIFITSQFQGWHRWSKAPEKQKFLRYLHRHLFGVKVKIEVFKNDREIEYFALKEKIEKSLVWKTIQRSDESSCEDMALELLRMLEKKYPTRSIEVEVNEDGENGSIIKNNL